LIPSTLINYIFVQWVAFTDDYPKPSCGSKSLK
jgi:hypothetical protein